MEFATVVYLVLQSVILVRENVRLLAKVVHELQLNLASAQQALRKNLRIFMMARLRGISPLSIVLFTHRLLRVLLTNN